MRTGNIAAVALACAALVLCVSVATGQVPQKMSYQVMLTDDADQPLADQSVQLMFRVYGVASGGVSLWTETHLVTTNSIGVASVILGSTNPLIIDFDVPLWLEIQVGAETLTPRRELVSAPYSLYAQDAGLVGGTSPGDFALAADLSATGTVNDTLNPVDWTKLKSVPDGFADGSDDTGAGDSHSLDADDGDPVDAVYVDADGNVGVGTAAPHEKLGIRASAHAYAHFSNALAGTTATDGFKVGIDSLGGAFLSQLENDNISFSCNNVYLGRFAAATGALELGDATNDGRLEVYRDGSSGEIGAVDDYLDLGGALDLNLASGAVHSQIRPDTDGQAGFLYVHGPGVTDALIVDGNDEGDGSPAIRADGAGSAIEIDLGETGDSSVVLPNDSVSSSETNDEPGVACYYAASQGQVLVTYSPMISHSITVPGPGYVMALATGQANCTHTTASDSRFYFGVSADSTVIPEGLDQEIQIDGTVASGAFKYAMAPASVFQVGSAGTYTFYMVASATGTWYVYDTAINLLYFPTAYGTVTGATKAAAPDDADAEIAASGVEVRRMESEAANDARIERELAEMDTKIAEIRESIARGNRP